MSSAPSSNSFIDAAAAAAAAATHELDLEHLNAVDRLLADDDVVPGSSGSDDSTEQVKPTTIDQSKHKAIWWALTNGIIRKVDCEIDTYTIDGVNTFKLDGNPESSKNDKAFLERSVHILARHCDEHKLFIIKPPSNGRKLRFLLPTHEVDGVIQYKPKHDKGYKSKPYGQKTTSGRQTVDRSVPKQRKVFTIIGENEDGMPVKITLASIIAFALPDGEQMTHPSFGMK
jgi:hypothetical protein